MAIDYTGNIKQIIAEKESYATGEDVRVKVNYSCSRTPGALFGWHSRVVITVGGQEVINDPIHHFTSPQPDVWTVWYRIGIMPAHDLTGRVDIYCGG